MTEAEEKIDLDLYDSDTGISLEPLHVEDVSAWTTRKDIKLVYTRAVKGPIVQLQGDCMRIHYFYDSEGGRKMIDEDTKRFGFQPGELLALVDRFKPSHGAA